jgi:histidine decarboxylase
MEYVGSIDDRSLEIGDAPDAEGRSRAQVRRLVATLKAEERRIIGFPGNLQFSFSDLGPILDVLFNNVGDNSSRDKTDANTKAYEYQVVRYFTRLAKGDPDTTYGYLSSGGSASNLWGIDLGLSRLPGAPIYCSDASHFSVREAVRLVRAEFRQIPTMPNGAMDADVLRELCAREPGRGAVIVATIGTTMTGAIDDIVAIRDAAHAAGDIHVHADAALGGPIAAFSPEKPEWGFPYADSVAISAHKFIGVPVPCSVALAKSDLVSKRKMGEYIGATNATLSTSRSGLAAALLWVSLNETGNENLEAAVLHSLSLAAYAEKKLNDIGVNAWLNPSSITVVFDRPDPRICAKWHLATEGDLAHIITLPHVTTETLDEFVSDLA